MVREIFSFFFIPFFSRLHLLYYLAFMDTYYYTRGSSTYIPSTRYPYIPIICFLVFIPYLLVPYTPTFILVYYL